MYRVSYKIVFLFILLSCVAAVVYADDAGQNKLSQAIPTSGAASETAIVLQTDETLLPVADTVAPQSSGRSSTAGMLFQLVISLAVVCALIYGVLYFIRRSKRFTAADDPFLKNVASLALAPNKNLHIVTLIDKAYLIGAADSSLSLIAEITDKELIDAMNLHAAQTAGPKQDFGSLLQTFFPAAKPQTAADPFDSFLSKQRERLQNTGTSQKEGTEQTPANSTLSSRGNRYTDMNYAIDASESESVNGRGDK
ncbi:MAG: FliO/MopB family protein [Treponema sp.]